VIISTARAAPHLGHGDVGPAREVSRGAAAVLGLVREVELERQVRRDLVDEPAELKVGERARHERDRERAALEVAARRLAQPAVLHLDGELAAESRRRAAAVAATAAAAPGELLARDVDLREARRRDRLALELGE
jgi:hypothetical protein